MIQIFVPRTTAGLAEVTEQAIEALGWPVCLRSSQEATTRWVVGGDHKTSRSTLHWLLEEQEEQGSWLSLDLQVPAGLSWGLAIAYLFFGLLLLTTTQGIAATLTDFGYQTWSDFGARLNDLLVRLSFLLALFIIHIMSENRYKALLTSAVRSWEEAARRQGFEPVVDSRGYSSIIFRVWSSIPLLLLVLILFWPLGSALSPLFFVLLFAAVVPLTQNLLEDMLVGNLYEHWKAKVLVMAWRTVWLPAFLTFNVTGWLILHLFVVGAYRASAQEDAPQNVYRTAEIVLSSLKDVGSLTPPEALATFPAQDQILEIMSTVASRFSHAGQGWPASSLVFELSVLTLAWSLYLFTGLSWWVNRMLNVARDWQEEVVLLSRIVPVGHFPGTMRAVAKPERKAKMHSILFKLGVGASWVASLVFAYASLAFTANALIYVGSGAGFSHILTIPLAWISTSTTFLSVAPFGEVTGRVLILLIVTPFILGATAWAAGFFLRAFRTLWRLMRYHSSDPGLTLVIKPICSSLRIRQPLLLLVPGSSSVQSFSLLPGSLLSAIELPREAFVRLGKKEQEAILAHEVWHIKNDWRLVSWLKLLSALSPGTGSLLTLTIDFAQREFAADNFVARYQGGYKWLWSALDYLEIYRSFSTLKVALGWRASFLRMVLTVRRSSLLQVLDFLYGDLVYGSAHPSLTARKLRLALAADQTAHYHLVE